jgi:prefoldin subunit 5
MQNSIHHAIKHMDSSVRDALAHDIAQETTQLQDLDKSIKMDLETLRAALKKSQEKEIFIGMRIHKYRMLLQDNDPAQHFSTKETIAAFADDDIESNDNSTNFQQRSRLQKWHDDIKALEQVKAAHKALVVQCEELRRAIAALEQRRTHVDTLKEECDQFCVAAAAQERIESAQHEQLDELLLLELCDNNTLESNKEG